MLDPIYAFYFLNHLISLQHLTLLTTSSVVIIFFCLSNISLGNHPSVLNPFGLDVADSTPLFPGIGGDPNLINQIHHPFNAVDGSEIGI